MHFQSVALKNENITKHFAALKRDRPASVTNRLAISWSNWGFGREPLEVSAQRLAKYSVKFIELHGNHYGPDLGYRPTDTKKLLTDQGIQVAGVCGMFSCHNDLSSNQGLQRQAALDYLKREIAFAHDMGGNYLLVVPGAVGRPQPYDAMECERSVETLQLVADLFVTHNVKAAIEPIRAAEVSFCHTISNAKRYIAAVNHPGVRHINGDIYHMQAGETHLGDALLEAGDMLINLHMADSHRGALGEGSLDLDTVIMALYLINFNRPGCYVTLEPLGAGGDPYPAMHGKPDAAMLDHLVGQSVNYFREREALLCSD